MIAKLNKKGAEKFLTLYWFLILGIIAGGLVAMVFIFYDYPYNIREIEGNIMINQISDCLSQNGNLDSKLFNGTNFNENFSLSKECSLNFQTESAFRDMEQYYVEVNFYSLNSKKPIFTLSEGFSNYKAQCSINPEEEYSRLVECVNRSFYSVNNSNGVNEINVLSIVRKSEKNVRAYAG